MYKKQYASVHQRKPTIEETHLLCVEPQTKQLFQVNLGTQETQALELEPGKDIDNKIKREEYKMDQLLDRSHHQNKWFFQNETAQNFRSQMVPFYLLEREASQYPVYVDNSNIDESLASDFKIDCISVRLSESVQEAIAELSRNNFDLMHKQRLMNTSGQHSYRSASPAAATQSNFGSASNMLVAAQQDHSKLLNNQNKNLAVPDAKSNLLEIAANQQLLQQTSVQEVIREVKLRNVSLLNTADKLIKKIEKEIEGKLKKKMDFSHLNNTQILKFKSVDSYAYGDTQLIYFVEVREFLRTRSTNLELVFISLNAEDLGQSQTQGRETMSQPALTRQKSLLSKYDKHFTFPPLIEHGASSYGAANRFGTHGKRQSINHSHSHQEFHSNSQHSQAASLLRKFANSIDSQDRPGTSHHQYMKQTTKKLNAGSSYQQQITMRYKNISIFGWYTPKNFKYPNPYPDLSNNLPTNNTTNNANNQNTNNHNLTQENRYKFNTFPTVSYHSDEQFKIDRKRKNQGNVSILRDQAASLPLIPFSADTEILHSCDVSFPLRINILSARSLTEMLRYTAHNKKDINAQPLRLMRFVTPQETTNLSVQKLLEDCQALYKVDSKASSDQHLNPQELLSPFGNQGVNKHFTNGFSKMKFKLKGKEKWVKKRSKKTFTLKPHQIIVQAALYLGCRRISCFSYSKPIPYSNTIEFGQDQFFEFYKPAQDFRLCKQRSLEEEVALTEERGKILKISCLPSCTRLCFNVLLLPEPGSCPVIKPDITIKDQTSDQRFTLKEGFVLGSCQVSLFDESFLIRQGSRDLRLWPFESFEPRRVCQGECYNKEMDAALYDPRSIADVMRLQVEFQTFSGKVGWRLQQSQSQQQFTQSYQQMSQRFNEAFKNSRPVQVEREFNQQNKEKPESINLEQETESLKQVKKLLDAYPMDLDEEDAKLIKIDTVLEYRNYIHKLPIFIKLIDFTDHEKIRICYDTLDGSGLAKDMIPEEALALLDGQFGDIKVRIFAVKKLSMLNDSQIALYMPQLVEALKYELFHHSPLAEFLLEKALRNTRVVGQAFFWSLKANLHIKYSRERFFLILERFLMCCGQFKNDFFKQTLVMRGISRVKTHLFQEMKNYSKDQAKRSMAMALKREEIRIKVSQQLMIAHARFDDRNHQMLGGSDHNMYATNVTEDSRHNESDFESIHFGRRVSHKSQGGAGQGAVNIIGGQGQGHNTAGDQIVSATNLQNRRASNKMDKSHGSSQTQEQQLNRRFEFDEKILEVEIDRIVAKIYKKINFGVTEDCMPIEGVENLETPTEQLKYMEHDEFYNGIKIDWQVELLYIPFMPKNPVSSFADKGCAIASSKQRPLFMKVHLANERETEASLKAYNSSHVVLQDNHHTMLHHSMNTNQLHQHQLQQNPNQNHYSGNSPQGGSRPVCTEEDENKQNHLLLDPSQTPININMEKGNSNPVQQAAQQSQELPDQANSARKLTKRFNDPVPETKTFMYKTGDDLRQDNLVQQLFKIMDRLWQSNGLDLQMMCYQVMVTGLDEGFIEIVEHATEISSMHKNENQLMGPWRKQSIINHFLRKYQEISQFSEAQDMKEMRSAIEKYNYIFLKSLAGQCVATYIMGIRDRHPGNYMLHNPSGAFFHIDFGHILGASKKKLGFTRDREPFILSNELHYFLKYFCQMEIKERNLLSLQQGRQSQKRIEDGDQSKNSNKERQSNFTDVQDIAVEVGISALTGLPSEEIKQGLKRNKFELVFGGENSKNEDEDKSGGGGSSSQASSSGSGKLSKSRPTPTPEWMEDLFEKLASQAFLNVRQNADIFINLLVLMLVSDLEELNQDSIGFIKQALFLNVSEEEATVSFKQEIDKARKQWYRPIDNLFHIFNDVKKERKMKAQEAKLAKKLQKEKSGSKSGVVNGVGNNEKSAQSSTAQNQKQKH